MKKTIPFAVSSVAVVSLMSIAIYANAPWAVARQYGAQTGASPIPSMSPSVSPTHSPSVNPISQELNNAVGLNVIHHVNQLEIEENETALTRLQTSGAQQIAQTFINDHLSNEQQVFSVAQSSNIPVYYFHRSTFEGAGDSQLSFLQDSDYDAAYLQLQLQGHQRALANLQMYSSQTLDPALQSLVTAAISMVQTHISLITAVQGGQIPSPSPSVSPSTSPTVSPTPSPTLSFSPTPTVR